MSFAETPLLQNDIVRLEPLAAAHRDDLAEAVGDLHTAWYTRIPSPAEMADEIEARLARQAAGGLAPWAVVDARTGRAVGMTTYLNLDEANRRLEVGSTWLGRAAHGTGINPAAKLLLLERAFEQLGCIAVELRTHWHNHQSREAIARLGAKQDGVLRSHKIIENGTIRDTVVFSILNSEWGAVRAGLEHRIARR